MKITHINPDGLYKSPAFSQAVVAEGGKTIYIVFVESLGVPGALVEIEAIAVVDA
jgi:hypothetical protein